MMERGNTGFRSARWRLSSAVGAAAVALLTAAMAPAASTSPGTGWDIANTGQPARDIAMSLSEGTWMSLDVSPDGKTIVFDLLDDIYTMPATGGEAKLIAGGPAMQRTPKFSPDGRSILYLSDQDGCDNIWIADADGGHARQVTHERVDLLMGPTWSADGRAVAASKIWSTFPKLYSSEIRLYDLAGGSAGRILVPTPENKRDVQEATFSPDGRYVYYTQRLTNPRIFVDANHINYGVERRALATGAVTEVAAGFGGAIAPQVSHDGKRIAFVRRAMGKTVLFVVDLATGEQRPVFDGLDRDLEADFVPQGNYYPRFAWFPDQRHIAIWAKGKIWKVDADGPGAPVEIPFHLVSQQRVTDPIHVRTDLAPDRVRARAIRHIALSPDGRTMVFTALGRLWRGSAAGGTPQPFSPEDGWAFEPSFSPDGRRVAFVSWDDAKGSMLRVAGADGRGARTLATSPGMIRQPRFSPDGRRIVYRIQDGDPSTGGNRAKAGIYWIDAAGGESRFVGAGDDVPMFSPDGARIYWVVKDGSGSSTVEKLVSATPEGLDVHEHARTPDVDTVDLRASPDLKWIAFRDRQQYYVTPFHETGESQLVAAASDAMPVAALTDKGGYALSWSADSRSVTWAMGPQLFRADVAAQLQPGAGLPQSYGEITLDLPADVPDGTVAFTGGRIITMRGDEVIEKGTVIVQRNRIVAVGAEDQVVVPAGAKRIDVSGKTLMPGLVDVHSHIDCCYRTGTTPRMQPSKYAALAFGVTTAFDPYPNELESYENSETSLAGITVSPRWLGTGQAIYGRAQKGDQIYVPIDSYADAQKLMARKRALGGTYLKSYKQPARFQRQMLVKAAREAGIDVMVEGESHFYNDLTFALDGHTKLEHNLPVANVYDDIVQFYAKAHVSNTPTLVVLFGELFGENFMYQTTQAWKEPRVRTYIQEVLSGYSPLGTPYGAPPYARAMSTIHAADEVYDVGFKAVARAVKKLDDGGTLISVGSHGEVPGLSQHWEMWLMSEGGMSPMRILRAATINGATSLDIGDQTGSLEAGKLADLLVLDKNPLDDIHNSTSIAMTMVNGRLYDATSMNEIGNHPRPRGRFWWESEDDKGIDWNAAWGG